MIESADRFFLQLWGISTEAAPYLLVGFAVAALLHRYVPTEWLVRFLGRGKVRSTAMAAALGAPLPLCSCSVVPTALALRKKGASRGATLAFFISTPETGVDSILLTYGLLGPVLAVVRPVAAVLSAFSAGLLLEALPDTQEANAHSEKECHRDASSPSPNNQASVSQPAHSCCESKPELPKPACCEGTRADPKPSCCEEEPPRRTSFVPNCLLGLRDSFFMLFDEIAIWVSIGLVLSALVAAFLPDEVFASAYGGGWRGMALAIGIGLPIYVCATASTPLAAVMVGKGFSVGAALVFLLVGPATNIGTMTIVWRMLGGWAIFSYLVSIIGVSLAFGIGVDVYFPQLGIGLASLGGAHDHRSSLFAGFFALFLWILLVWRSARKFVPFQGKKG